MAPSNSLQVMAAMGDFVDFGAYYAVHLSHHHR